METVYLKLFYGRHLILYSVFLFLSLNYTFGKEVTSNDSNTRTFKNEKFYFSINLPNDWKTVDLSNSNSNLQLSSQNPNERQSIFIYVIEAKKDIDLKKLASSDSMLFKNLGELITTKKIRKHLFFLKGIEKSYESNTYNTKLLFQVKDNLGYIIMWESFDKDSVAFLKIADTFRVSVPLSKIVSGWFKGIWSWILGIVFTLIGIGFLFLIGQIGKLIRKGVETKKLLFKLKKEALLKGLDVNEKWHSYNKKSSVWILLPILGWIVIYIILFLAFSLKIFLISLLGLIPLVLGYYGIFFTPSKEPEEYL